MPVGVIYSAEVSRYRPLADTVHIVFSSIRFKIGDGNLRTDCFDRRPCWQGVGESS